MKKILGLFIFTMVFVVSFSIFSKANNESEYASSVLVSPEEAYEIIQNDTDIVVLDVRQETDFTTGHVEGSYDIWRPKYGAEGEEYDFRGMRANPEKLASTLSSYGIMPETHIILMGKNPNYDVTRLFWLLEMYGHEKATIVEGGIDAWIQAGLPTATGEAQEPTPSEYEFINEVDLSKLASLDDVISGIDDPDVVILDTRTYEEYDGLALYDGAFIKGRIPNSAHLQWNVLMNEDGSFKSVEELEEILETNDITKDKTIISYCQSGVRSSNTTFILGHLLGWDNVKNYDGSWIEWSYNVEQGSVENEKDNIFKVLFSYLTNREKLEDVLLKVGIWGPIIFIIVLALVTITMISVVPIAVTGGIVFGPLLGILYTAIGASIGLSLAFLIARYIAKNAIEKKFGNTNAFKKINEGVERDGWFILATTRLLPIFPFGVQNYVYGLTSISFIKFALLSTIFILPGTSVFVMLAGAFASGDTKTVVTYSIIASLIFFVLMLVTKVIKKKSEMNQEKK